MSKRKSSFHVPRVKLLAAALSMALPAVQAVAAGNPHHNSNGLNPLTFAFSGFRNAGPDYLRHAPKSTAPARAPMTRSITSMADAGAGSLRDALASAVDGDVIDLSELRGRIVLSSPLEATAAVTINGPGQDRLTLDGGGHGRVLESAHSLTVSKVTIANGLVSTPKAPGPPPYGGCVLAYGFLALQHATLTDCHVVATGTDYGFGGAIAVVGSPGTAYLKYDTITNNSVTSGVEAVGGGVVAYSALLAASTISGNSVVQADGTTTQNIAAGGGIVTLGGELYSVYSTISGNSAAASGGTYYDPVAHQSYREYGVAAGGGAFAQSALIGASTISNNTLTANNYALGGGAILGDNSAVYASLVTHNSVYSSLYSTGGGGVFAAGSLNVAQSAITANQASSGCVSCFNLGGGIGGYGSGLSVFQSTISGNSLTTTGATAQSAGGGIGVKYSGNVTPSAATLTNSTVSGNSLTGAYVGHSNGAGIWIGGNLALNNSTVAFNVSDGVGGGITVGYSGTTPYTNTLYSSIVANNTAGFDASTADLFSFGTQTIAGSNDLVMAAGSNITVPGGTLSGDPLLQPLAFNGGPTQTHALGAGSPAIDAGAAGMLTVDQRGYTRVVGAGADIGAYELDTDRIFTDGFDFTLLQ